MAYLQFIRQVVKPSWVLEVGQVIDDTDDPEYWRKFVYPRYGKAPAARYMTPEETKDFPVRPILPVPKHKKSRPFPRPHPKLLTSLVRTDNVTRLDLPGNAFNAGLAALGSEYVLVYRATEYTFAGCLLDRQFKPSRHFSFLNHCGGADGRLIWSPDGDLLMSYSAFKNNREAIFMTTVLRDGEFLDAEAMRISPTSLEGRQKNWLPFVFDSTIYFVASVCPHVVYEWNGTEAIKRYETNWKSPWFYKSFLRGNTNIVPLDDGTFLGTFHTGTQLGQTVSYDNGVYQFEGKPPFRVLRCSDRTYLRAEDAIEPHKRNSHFIRCTFPVGMVREGERILISYGDQDSCVKILDTTVEEMLATTVDVREKRVPLL